jgi:hypothetical protein
VQCLKSRTVHGKPSSARAVWRSTRTTYWKEYPWQAAYQAAVLETNDSAMSLRIYEALAAIEQRRLSYLDIGEEENRALERAEQGLLALKAERLDPSGTQ